MHYLNHVRNTHLRVAIDIPAAAATLLAAVGTSHPSTRCSSSRRLPM